MSTGVVGFVLALVAALGVFFVFTSVALGWRGLGFGPDPVVRRDRRRVDLAEFLVQSGLDRVGTTEFLAAIGVLAVIGFGLGYGVFGGVLPGLAVAVGAMWLPVGSARARRARRREQAREAWPRMIEEIRLQAVSLGRSIPQALFTVGARGPEELRPAFAAARREWLISTDFDRTLDVLKARLADPTADAVCETLLIAHEIGGSDVDRRLRALIDDRIDDLQGRKDARAKQAGARFARFFVLIVPLGMSVVGLTIGQGREAYQTALGQLAVLVAFAMIAGCWLWAGQLMKLPEEERVFRGRGGVG
ncbi:MAG: type II secretion system F family protein [Actinomycetes bacterium]